jgi:uncharacterized protein (TIGR02271 family)
MSGAPHAFTPGVAYPVEARGKGGWHGIVHHWGEDEITIRFDSGETVVVPDSAVTGRPDGSCYVALSVDEIRGISNSFPESEPVVIPVIHEELEVGKRRVETGAGVRVQKSAYEEEQVVDVPLLHEQVEVQRVPVDRVVDGPVAVRHVGDTIIVPVMQEVLVVQKQLRLVEELHIRRTRTERRDPRTVVLRKEEATVERLEDPQEG